MLLSVDSCLPGSFETENRKNFDALELLYANADLLNKKERKVFIELVLYFKNCPGIDPFDDMESVNKMQR